MASNVKTVYVVSRLVEFVCIGSPEASSSVLAARMKRLAELIEQDREASTRSHEAAEHLGVQAQAHKPEQPATERAWATPAIAVKPGTKNGHPLTTSNTFEALTSYDDADEQDLASERLALHSAAPAGRRAPAAKQRSIGTCCKPRKRSMAVQCEMQQSSNVPQQSRVRESCKNCEPTNSEEGDSYSDHTCQSTNSEEGDSYCDHPKENLAKEVQAPVPPLPAREEGREAGRHAERGAEHPEGALPHPQGGREAARHDALGAAERGAEHGGGAPPPPPAWLSEADAAVYAEATRILRLHNWT